MKVKANQQTLFENILEKLSSIECEVQRLGDQIEEYQSRVSHESRCKWCW